MENRNAIVIKGVKKQYRLGVIGGRTLQSELKSWWAKKRGKDDPNLPVGVRGDLIGKTFIALDGISLTIRQGESVGIIGANGAGKSTLLKILSQITAPTEGDIDIYGRITSMLEIGTGFHGEMTGRENIYMNGAILGMTKAEIESRMEDIIEFSEIREFIDTPVKRYSSGMFVKLAFAVAAHLQSEIMIMDEVLAVGDMAFQKKCLDKMRKTAMEDGRTILYVSHNMETIRKLCSRCIVLDKGKIIFDGDVEKAIALYMDKSISGNQLDTDLTEMGHIGHGESLGIQMTRVEIIDKITPVFEEGEALKLALTVKVDKPLENMIIGTSVRTDTDTGIGTMFSEKMSFSEVGLYRIEYELSLESFIRGIFYINLGIYREEELGRKLVYDRVERALKIEITGNNAWYTGPYGYIRIKSNTSCRIERLHTDFSKTQDFYMN